MCIIGKEPLKEEVPCYFMSLEEFKMKHISTIQKPCINAREGSGCGECQASCQSACKTSCTVANQKCKKESK